MRRLLLVSLLALAIPTAAEARRISMHSLGQSGQSDATTLGFEHGNGGHHGLALGLGHGLHTPPDLGFPPGPPVGVPPGPPPDLQPPGLGLGHGGFPRTRHGNHLPAPVPEPGTALMLIAGMLGLAWKARARR